MQVLLSAGPFSSLSDYLKVYSNLDSGEGQDIGQKDKAMTKME